MINLEYLRTHLEEIKQIIANGRGNKTKADLDKWQELDEKRRKLILELDALNQSKNELAKLGKDKTKIEELRTKGQELKLKAAKIDEQLKVIDKEWQDILDWVPNIPHKDMPVGTGEEDNLSIAAWAPQSGYLPKDKLGKAPATASLMPVESKHWNKSDLNPQHHLDIGERLGIIDNKQAAKVSGTRFTYLFGDLALMQYGIQQLMFGELLKRGFKPIIPPLLLKEASLYGSSHFPEGKDQVYKIDTTNVEDQQELFLVGSSEPANFSFFKDKLLQENELPLKVFAYTSCFRSEAGSWGRDTKGIKRVHQFDKIEMNAVCLPEQSDQVFDEFLSINEWLLQTLEIPYQLALKCTGDAGYLASAKQIDPEAWLPGQKEFMEVGTDTNTTDFQARRLNIRFNNKDGKKEFVHTVNDTGVAMGRMLIAIIDNYQQSDGSIKVPRALVPLIGKEFIGK